MNERKSLGAQGFDPRMESLHLEGCSLPGGHEGPCDDEWSYSTETVSPHDAIIASPRYRAALELIAETPYSKFSDPITYSSFVRDIAKNALDGPNV